MFRILARFNQLDADALFQLHPLTLAITLEQAWELCRASDPTSDLGLPFHRSDLEKLPLLDPAIHLAGPLLWDHLIYAYLIENTRIYEIFRRVLYEFLHGEQLGVPLPGSEHWLRNTEELFYKNPAPFLITAVASQVRDDLRGTRRAAYYRMFGMDLNHGTDDKKEYPYVKAKEFYAVSTLSRFHLTVESDSPIVQALRAEATSPEERLFKIAERIGLPAHGLSRSFFQLADPMSRILTLIERETFDSDSASAFYTPPPPDDEFSDPTIPQDMRTIITQWSIVTGHDMKNRKVSVAG